MQSDRPRQPEGTPIGGQWAAKGHSEPDAVALDVSATDGAEATGGFDFGEVKAGYLATAGYETIEDWARDSDYTEQPEGSGNWVDEHGNQVDLDVQLYGALDASGELPLDADEKATLRAEASTTVAAALDRIIDNGDLDTLRERDPEYPLDAHQRAVGALRDLRDHLDALAAGTPLKGEGTDRSPSSSFYDYEAARKQADEAAERLVEATIAHVSDVTRDAYPDAAMIVVRRDDDEFESLRPRFVLDADGNNISGTINDSGRKKLETWRRAVEGPIGEAGGHRDAVHEYLDYALDLEFDDLAGEVERLRLRDRSTTSSSTPTTTST